MPDPVQLRRGFHRTFWATLAFLIAFTALLSLIADYFMRPAIQAAHVATPPERRELSAISILLLSILLTMLTIGLLLTFRVRRFFTSNKQK